VSEEKKGLKQKLGIILFVYKKKTLFLYLVKTKTRYLFVCKNNIILPGERGSFMK
jgi:hypothetical protein